MLDNYTRHVYIRIMGRWIKDRRDLLQKPLQPLFSFIGFPKALAAGGKQAPCTGPWSILAFSVPNTARLDTATVAGRICF